MVKGLKSAYILEKYFPARLTNANASLNFRLNNRNNKNNNEDIAHWLDYVDFDIPVEFKCKLFN